MNKLEELKKKADAKNVAVIVSMDSGTCKAILPEHLFRIPHDTDDDGIHYTEDHLAYMRTPSVVL